MKRLGIYIAVLLVLLISLSLWFGSSAETQIQQLLTQTQQNLSPSYDLNFGDISVSPFAGNIDVTKISISDSSGSSTYEFENLELDLSYIDFLRVYLKGMEQGLREINGMQINLDNPIITIDSLQISSAEINLHHRGPTRETLAALFQDRRPNNSIYINAQAYRLAFNRGVAFREIQLNMNYDPALQNFTLQRLDIDDPAWTGSIRGSIRMNSTTTSFSDWSEVNANYILDKQQEADDLLYQSEGMGQVYGSSLELSGDVQVTSTTPTELWARFPMQLQGGHEITGYSLTWKPSAQLAQRYMPLMALQTAQPDGIRIEEFHVKLDRSMRSNQLLIEDFTVITPMMTLSGDGALQLYPGDLLAARFVETELRAGKFSAGMKQLIQGAARFFNIKNADRDAYRLRITGPLRSPQFLPME